MMASIITNMQTKTSVVRKPRDGYRFTIDVGTLNAWQFDLSDSEFEEFLRQVTRAHGPVQESCMTTPEPPNKPAQTNVPQPPPTGTDHPDYYGWHPVAECIEVSQHFNGNLAQVIQYIWRCGRKPGVGAVKDLEKAISFLRFEIDRIKRFEHKKLPPTQAFDKMREKFGGKFNDFDGSEE